MRLGLVALLAASGAIARADIEYAPPPLLPTIEQRFANGMLVIVAPDPAVASVAVHVRYLGGTDDEIGPPGTTLLVERLLFAGSVHVHDGELEQRIEAAGGWANSAVTADYLATSEEVPAQALELVLWLEAERIAGLGGGLTDAHIARESAAILAEHAPSDVEHGIEMRLWGIDHPVKDLAGLGVAAARNLVARQLDPGRTVVVIAGRVDPGAVTALAQRYFGWIPRPAAELQREVKPVGELAPLSAFTQLETADPVPKAVVAFRTNKPYALDTVALELAARLLAGDRTSRLPRRLVDGGLATEVHAELIARRRGGELRFVATARPGVDPERLATEIRRTIGELRDAPLPIADVERAATAEDAELVASVENLAVRAQTIADWALGAGTSSYLETARANLRSVTPDDLQRAARYWLADAAGVVVIGR